MGYLTAHEHLHVASADIHTYMTVASLPNVLYVYMYGTDICKSLELDSSGDVETH